MNIPRFVVALLVFATPVVTTTAQSAQQPNVLFIAVDDLNDWIGCMKGHPQALTPNMDRLAARGVLFTNAHCTAPACNPSRSAVFSGRMPNVTGIWANQAGMTLDRLYPNGRLLPTAFSQAGYQTFGTGKLLHSGGKELFDDYFSLDQRWSPLRKTTVEYTAKELPTKGTNNPRHVVKDSRGRTIVLPLNRMPSDRKPDAKDGESFDWGPFDVPDSDFGDTQMTDWAMGKIKETRDKPFFLGVGYYRPHIPLWAPKRFFDRFGDSPGQLPQVKRDDLDDLSETARKWALEPVTAGSHATVVKHQQWQAAVEAYLACVTYVDHEIGRLLDTLDTSPFGDNTVIVLWSDHGWHLGEKEHWGKWTGWERSTKVPLIIVPPKTRAGRFAPAGSRCDQPVGLIDLYPTLTALCGVAPPDKLDGQSLVPLLSEPDTSTGRGVVTMFDPGNTSLRTEHWRYIRYADGSEELYDHRDDPNEWDNLADSIDHRETKKRLSGRKPNFIFVLSDDIAQGDLGCYGQKLIKTPRIDQMAAEGTRYLQAYCGTSVCAPSRSSFFTGLHTGHCPVRGNYEVPPEGQLPLPDKTVTIAEVAKSARYSTATFGKWGMGFFDSSGSPFNQGVDHFFGYNCQRHAHSYFPTYLYDDAQPFVLPGNDGQSVGETYAQELIQNDMINWVRKHADQPFMLFYAITLPHGRHEIDDYGIYRDKPWTEQQKAYAAQVTRVDSDMGELADTLRELGIAENTLIIFSGDNGSSFDPQSEIGKLFDQASNGLRGYKRGMYEGALRQAAFAWWPGTVAAGRVDKQPWAFWDLMPTFVEMSGATPPEGYETDGKSLVEYLKGGDAPQRDYFYWELHPGNKPIQAARFDNWKAVRNGIDTPIEIYDLTDDSAESENLAKARPDLVQKALRIFEEAHRPDPHWPLDRRPEAHTRSAQEAWEIKRQRDKTKWIPDHAVNRPD